MKQLDKIDPKDNLVRSLHDALRKKIITMNSNRKMVGKGRTIALGYANKPYALGYGLTNETREREDLYRALIEFGHKYVPLNFTTIQVNHNYICAPHMDSGNSGESYIVALGEYKGGELCIEENEYDIRYAPLIFDGTKHLHYVKPILSGDRYSVVFFTLIPKPPSVIYTARNYVVAIPSYGRSIELNKKTLSTLARHGIPSKKIHIFVANEDEYKRYIEETSISMHNAIIVGVLGLTAQKAFIKRFFGDGSRVLMMDDDVSEVNWLKEDALEPIGNMNKFIEDAFEQAHAKRLHMWGVYPVNNHFFMSEQITTSLRFIMGTMYGIIVRNSPDLEVTMDEKEDVENTILHYIKDGGVLRFNNVSLKTVHYQNGGLGTTRERIKKSEESVRALSMKYPDYGTVFIRKNGIYEFKLKKKK